VVELWPGLLAGKGGKEILLSLSLDDANPDLFSQGRQEMVNEMLAEFAQGYIDTGVDPVSGEPEF
jgi:hypothetical protein